MNMEYDDTCLLNVILNNYTLEKVTFINTTNKDVFNRNIEKHINVKEYLTWSVLFYLLLVSPDVVLFY